MSYANLFSRNYLMLTFSITLFVNRIPVEGILLYSLAVLSTCIPACSLLNILSQKRVNSHFIPCDDEWYIFVQQTNSKHSSKQLCWLFDPWNCFYIKLSKLPPHILNMTVFFALTTVVTLTVDLKGVEVGWTSIKIRSHSFSLQV